MNNKQLYKISKYAYQEAFFQSQLDMAGSQQDKILEKMEKNKKYMKTQGIMLKFVVMFYLAFLIMLPIHAFQTIQQAISDGMISTNILVFGGSITLSIFFLVQTFYLIMFGMFFASSLLSGEYLPWLTTLPIAMKDMQKITLMTFFRGLDAQFITIFLVFPIGTAIVTLNPLIVFVSLIISGINVVFSFGILVIIGEKVHRIMGNNEANSKRGTYARIAVMSFYAIGTMVVAMGFNLVIPFVDKILSPETYAAFSSINLELLNKILSLIPGPFTASYTMINILINYQGISTGLILTSIGGLILYIGLTIIVFRKALHLLSNVITAKSKSYDENAVKTTVEDVIIKITPPVSAFFKKDKQMATRDIQMFMLILMPIILPLIGLATTGFIDEVSGSSEGLLILFTMNVGFYVMSGVMIIYGILTVESTGATINASLPIVVRDQVNAKMRWVFLILITASLIPLIFYIGKDNFLEFLILTLLFTPFGIITALISLELKVWLFGKMKYKYVIEEVNLRYRFLKWLFISIIALIIYIGAMVILISYQIKPTEDYLASMATILVPIEAGIGVLLYFFYNKMFPKPKEVITAS